VLWSVSKAGQPATVPDLPDTRKSHFPLTEIILSARRLVTLDPYSPGQFRAIRPHVNLQQFYDAFDIKSGSKMWREPELRAKIW
jgi:hypothetical protein